MGYIPFGQKPPTCSSIGVVHTNRPATSSSNKPFGRWGEVFGDDVVAAAMIIKLVHHAEVIALKGDATSKTETSTRPHRLTDDQ